MQRAKRPVMAGILASALMMLGTAPLSAQASETYVDQQPSELALMGDVLIGRPFLTAWTGIGFAAFAVTLPFSALGDNVDETAEMMVRAPGRAAFRRCMGCTPAQHEARQVRKRLAEKEASAE